MDGTVNRAGATCLVCGSPVPRQHLWDEGRAHRMGVQLMAIVAEGARRRMYLSPTEPHELAAAVPRPDDVPDSEMPNNPRWFSPPMYGMTHSAIWASSLSTFSWLWMLVGPAQLAFQT